MTTEEFLHVEHVEMVEPRHVIVNGWEIPGLRSDVDIENEVVVLYYGAMAVEIPHRYADRIVAFVANSITVAQGFGGLPAGDWDLTRVTATQPRRVHFLGGGNP